MEVRPVQSGDYDLWLPLWLENMEHQVKQEVTDATWASLCDDETPVYGLGIFDQDSLSGILHYILHPTTGSLNPVCYMQDLYIDPSCRRQGLARELLTKLVEIGRQARWERIYWIASEDNENAQKLYKNIGVKLNFTFHVLPLNLKF